MSKDSPSPVDLAAAVYGCSVDDLMAYHEFEDGSVAIIAPTGQKFTYPAERLLQELVNPTEEEGRVSDVQAAISEALIGLIGDIKAEAAAAPERRSSSPVTEADEMATETPDLGAGHVTKKTVKKRRPAAKNKPA